MNITEDILRTNGFEEVIFYKKKFNWRKLRYEKTQTVNNESFILKKGDIKIVIEYEYNYFIYVGRDNQHYRCNDVTLEQLYKFHMKQTVNSRKERLKSLIDGW